MLLLWTEEGTTQNMSVMVMAIGKGKEWRIPDKFSFVSKFYCGVQPEMVLWLYADALYHFPHKSVA